MADASYEVLYAVINALRDDATVTGYVGTRIYDRPPEGTLTSPYISMGPTDAQRADVECVFSKEVYIQVDVWSWGTGLAYGSAEVRKIAGAVEDAIHTKSLTLTTNRLVAIEHSNTQVMLDPDGTTHHAVVQFVAYVEAR